MDDDQRKRRRIVVDDEEEEEDVPDYGDRDVDSELGSNPDELLSSNPSDEEEGEDLMGDNWME